MTLAAYLTQSADIVRAAASYVSADKMERVRLKVCPPLMGPITYSTPCGKFLPIVTPFRTKNKDLLIIAIRVQPCNGGK